jgi:tripartite-type tricarboxylate transporter receptor subunit TctC
MGMIRFCFAVILLCAAPGLARSESVTEADFFKTRTLRIVVGYAAGGSSDGDPRVPARRVGHFTVGQGNGFDLYARLLALHLGRHLPGHPNVIVQNLPGAGGLRATMDVVKNAPADGLTLLMPSPQNVVEPLFDPLAAPYDPRSLGWIGSMNREVTTCAFWNPQIQSIDDLRQRRAFLGGTGPLASGAQETRAIEAVLGAQFHIVLGYPYLMDIRYPAERGEVDGFCGLLISSIGPGPRSDLAAGKFRLLLQTGLKPHREVGDLLPLLSGFAKDEASRDMLLLAFAPWEFGKPLAAPPRTPASRLTTLRQAFRAAIEDPDLLRSASVAGLEINPVGFAEIETLIARLHTIAPSSIEHARQIMRPASTR